MKYIRYRRVSRAEKDTGSSSLEWQAAQIDEWCQKNKVQTEKDFSDDGVSAKKPLRRRPRGVELMAEAAQGPCTIIVAKLDRIFRDTEDFLVTWGEWARHGVVLESVNDRLEMLTASGKLSATIIAAVHQWERQTTGERVKAASLQKKRTGLRYAPVAPYGFLFEGETTDGEGKKHGGTLLRTEDEQRVIESMKEWHRRGWTLRKIAAKLTCDGVPTRHGKPWSHSTVKKILQTAGVRLSKKPREDGQGHAAPDLTIHVEPEKEDG